MSIRYSGDAESLSVRVSRRMVVLLVGGMGNCCGRPMWLGSCIVRKLNMIWLKPRILGLIMKTKNLFMSIKMKINANNVIMFVCVPCLSECDAFLKKNRKKMPLRILPKCGYGLVSNVVNGIRMPYMEKI